MSTTTTLPTKSENSSVQVVTPSSEQSKAPTFWQRWLTFENIRKNRTPDFIIGDNYLRRWWIIPRNKWFNIYLHEINKSDDDRALHDHPWWNLSIVLKGGYDEVTPRGTFPRRAGQFIGRSGSSLHRLVIPDDGQAVTLFLTGPNYREWGFACPKGWRKWEDFCATGNKGQVGRGCE